MTQGAILAMLMRMKNLYQKQPNGVYYFRKRVPSDLVERVGKSTWMQSLRTHDTIKAQVAAKQLDKELAATWSKLRTVERGTVFEAQALLEAHNVGVHVEGHGNLGLDLLLD